jgi:hypothetical protein
VRFGERGDSNPRKISINDAQRWHWHGALEALPFRFSRQGTGTSPREKGA